MLPRTVRKIELGGRILLAATGLLICATLVLSMTGCGGFRFEVDPPGPDSPTGHIAQGVGETITTAGQFLPPPWNWIATAAGGILAGGGAAGAVATRKTKEVADADFEDGYKKGLEAVRAEQ